MMRALAIVSTLLATVALGCLGPSPNEQARSALGDTDHEVWDGDEYEADETHRPGQPCLVCHSRSFHPGDAVFDIAGTVYLTPDSEVGQRGVVVTITDAVGNGGIAVTNETGNFMFAGPGADGDDDEGTRLRFDIEWPVTVDVAFDGTSQIMRNRIWREGSCAYCHESEAGPGSAGRIYIRETL